MQNNRDISTNWFEDLYKSNYLEDEKIPWANMEQNIHLKNYVKENSSRGRALVIGCGLGDDAILLDSVGFDVVAIDISKSAINWCKERFKDNHNVDFIVQDIFELKDNFIDTFDFVFEFRTIQSLPIEYRQKIIKAISSTVKTNGKILVLTNTRNENQIIQGPPWPLSISDIKLFEKNNMKELSFNIVKNENNNISNNLIKAVYLKK